MGRKGECQCRNPLCSSDSGGLRDDAWGWTLAEAWLMRGQLGSGQVARVTLSLGSEVRLLIGHWTWGSRQGQRVGWQEGRWWGDSYRWLWPW